MHELRLSSLSTGHRLGIEGNLQDGRGFRFEGELTIADLIGPISQVAWLADLTQDIGFAKPITIG